ncbi:hypothetical protein HGH93_21640 [Chitinophaga polysaccharea]|uniref:hypothetical protein n=1 Tax=Chitinophaga polysaccharea TaxID=1293035 RepID=UPI0014553B88|nr:hypothetical protein [Chitinophaga polysaccharea]NLR60728.1 hypothetical protein [Chitinophaga polysaccharea]
MKKIILSLAISGIVAACNTVKQGTTQGDPKNAVSYGYQPLDPLPVSLISTADKTTAGTLNERYLKSLPDETMRLAIGEVDGSGNISFGSAKFGYAGSSYIIILDYIKFATHPFPVKIDNTSKEVQFTVNGDPYGHSTNTVDADAVIPVYVGVGLRLSATIKVNKGTVDLGNLFAIGAAAEANKVTGTLIIQTLGISGESISGLIPMPSQINSTTIQNAVLSLGSIKAKLFASNVDINPRIVGFYNNIGGGEKTTNKFISTFLTGKLEHIVN